MATNGLAKRRRSIQQQSQDHSELAVPSVSVTNRSYNTPPVGMTDSASSNSLGTVQTLIRSIHRGRKSGTNKRLIHKNGEFNISQKGIKKRKQQYLADIFTTLIDLKWRWSLVLFVTAFLTTWLVFGFVWWLIAFFHGDTKITDPSLQQCVTGVNSYVTALLFSIETQHTIGYGTRSITETCPEAIVTMMAQSTFGVIIQALMTGLIFAKLARPQKRAETLMFSKKAVICARNGQLVLLIRVGDMRSSHIIGAHMDALLIRRRVTSEGEIIPLETENVDLGFANNRLLLRWPVIIEHRINERSPFWKMSKIDFERENFEFLVILEGSVPSTGASTQAMTSYLPEEIAWGHRFERLVTNQRDDGKYLFNYTSFNNILEVDTPSCCGEELLARHLGLTRTEEPVNNNVESVPRHSLQTNIHNWMLDKSPVGFTLSGPGSDGGSSVSYTLNHCQSVQAPLQQESQQDTPHTEGYVFIRVKCSDMQTDSPLSERKAKLCQLITDDQFDMQSIDSNHLQIPKLPLQETASDVSGFHSLAGTDNGGFDTNEEASLSVSSFHRRTLFQRDSSQSLKYVVEDNSCIPVPDTVCVDIPEDNMTQTAIQPATY